MKKHINPKLKKLKNKETSKKKVKKVLHEFKSGELHSGVEKGPIVTSRKQAVAIALDSARKLKKKRKNK